MGALLKNLQLQNWFLAVRGYSLLISFTSWTVPFLYSILRKGNILYGIIALAGILILHMATNIFDDTVDYETGKREIECGIKKDFNFQNSKCALIFNKTFTINQFKAASLILFSMAFVIAVFFLNIYGAGLLKIIIPTIVLCLSYPKLGCLGFGELIVALIFSPLMYMGVNYVMCGSYSLEILLVSISTGLLSVAVLHNHMLLDYNYDQLNRKTTLCRLCKSKENALYLLGAIIILAYLNITILIILNKLSIYYLLIYFSLPTAAVLYNVMKIHIKNPQEKINYNIFMGNISEIKKVPENQRDFLLKFIIMRNLLNAFTILICTAMILTCILLKN